MASTEANNQFTSQAEGAIQRMGLESYEPYQVQPLNLPQSITPADVGELVNASLAAGIDPTDDPKVQRALIQRGVMEHTNMIRVQQENAESARRVAAVKEQAFALIEEMKAKFEAATDELREAYKILGDERIWDQHASWPPHDRNWPTRIKARAALWTTDNIITNWGYLIQTVHGPLGITAPIQTYAVPTLADHERHGLALGGRRQTGGETGVWDMLIMGVAVDLATTNAEVRERVNAITKAKASRTTKAMHEMRI